MANVFEFVAEARNGAGTKAARAVRRQGKVPAVIYGGESQPELLVLDHNEIMKHLVHEAVYSHVLDIKIGNKTEKAVLKHIQRHPAKPVVLHMDFLRVDDTHKLKVHVPLHFVNESVCAGIKKGGIVTHALVDVEVLCMPSALPEYIEVDLADADIGDTIHLSDLILPPGVEVAALLHGSEHDQPVAQILKARTTEESSE